LIGEVARPVPAASVAFENVAVSELPQPYDDEGGVTGKAGPTVTDPFAPDAPKSNNSQSAQATNAERTGRTTQT